MAFDCAQDDRGKDEKRKRFPIDSIGDRAMVLGPIWQLGCSRNLV